MTVIMIESIALRFVNNIHLTKINHYIKMKRSILTLLLFSLLTATSCKPDKELEPALKRETIVGDYIVTAITIRSGALEQDVREYFMEDCEYDDVIHFKADLTFEVTDEGVQCDPPTHEVGPWDIIDNNTFVLDEEEVEVKKWDGKELHFARPDFFNGQEVSVVFKLQKL